jgi:hypothetical protein
MGMYDNIRCEIPLPDGFTGELQTKDFGCEMVEHVITKDGRLMLSRIDRVEEVPKAERPYPNDDGLLGLCGSVRTFTSLHDANFHGVVNFYGFEGDVNTMREAGSTYRWHEYSAKFTDGRLVGLELINTE